jgi:hypothetical protein
MTTPEKIDLLKQLDSRSMRHSKKFVAFLLMELLLGAMAILALKWQPSLGWPLAAFMVMTVLVMGFIAVMYIGKQADLEKFLKLAAIGTAKKEELLESSPSTTT